MTPTEEDVRQNIALVCDRVKFVLLDKNRKYGNSATDPVRIFSRANAQEQLLVRIDDKLSRIMRGSKEMIEDEDVVQDLIGYLILLIVQRESRSEKLP